MEDIQLSCYCPTAFFNNVQYDKPTEEVKKFLDERISTKIVLLGERVRERNLLYHSHVKKSG